MATSTAVASAPLLIPAERRGVELAVDMRRQLEERLKKCAVQAEHEVNSWELGGKSPDKALCEKLKEGYPGSWALFLGNRKHVAAWLCLREELPKLIPKDRFLLEPRFMYNSRLQRWEYMDENFISQIVHRLGYKGLEGTLRPDLIILDANHVIIYVYDFKFPCPETHPGRWERYMDGPWVGSTQRELYEEATHVVPLLVTPREGVVPDRP